MRVTICNRAAEAAKLHVLPQLWARNIWSWQPHAPKPLLRAGEDGAIAVEHPQLPPLRLYCDGRPELLFCENETNFRRLYGINAAAGTCKDGINDYIVYSDLGAPHVLLWGAAIRNDRLKPEAICSRDVDDNSCSHNASLNCFGRFGNRPNESDH
jgi:hypothetical protein